MCQTTPEKIPAPFYGDGFTVWIIVEEYYSTLMWKYIEISVIYCDNINGQFDAI